MSEPAQQLDVNDPLEAVIRRLDRSAGFPALSSNITDINRIVSSDSESVSKLTRAILRDVSMTNKLLQMVNSASYGQFRGRIHTVSKAVLLLGFDAVRSMAMSLMMIGFSETKGQNRAMRDEIVAAYFAGVVSRSLCSRMEVRNSEEAVICTMFQNLGRLIATFFLYDESVQVQQLMDTGISEELASFRILGISYRDLGVGVARHWNFPDRLIEGMHAVNSRDVAAPPKSDAAKLIIAANLANELCGTALSGQHSDKSPALDALIQRYGKVVDFKADDLGEAINASLKEFADAAPALNLPVRNSNVLGAIRNWVGEPAQSDAQAQHNDASAPSAQADAAADPLLSSVTALEVMEQASADTNDPEQVLADGIRDVTETLVTEFRLNDVLQMVLETMYRGMGFKRSMIFIRDNKQGVMRARFGFGPSIESTIPKCSFPLAFAPDVFHVALDKGVDIIIEDAQATNIAERIPNWHRQVLSASSFLLLPVAVRQQVIGLFYADWDRAAGTKVTPQQLGLLRTLRSQVVLAFKQRM